MSELEYEPVPIEMSGADRVRYAALTIPANAVKMGLWRARERLYDVIGRSPSAHTLRGERSVQSSSS
jgi:hypothetical protein